MNIYAMRNNGIIMHEKFALKLSRVPTNTMEPRGALHFSGVPRNFFSGGVQQIQLRTEDREDGDLGAVAS